MKVDEVDRTRCTLHYQPHQPVPNHNLFYFTHFCRLEIGILLTMNKNIVLILGLLLSLATTGWSQKFGYCNSSALLAEIPEVKAADSDLQGFQKQLTKKIGRAHV